jgi:hypothetical protein
MDIATPTFIEEGAVAVAVAVDHPSNFPHPATICPSTRFVKFSTNSGIQ